MLKILFALLNIYINFASDNDIFTITYFIYEKDWSSIRIRIKKRRGALASLPPRNRHIGRGFNRGPLRDDGLFAGFPFLGERKARIGGDGGDNKGRVDQLYEPHTARDVS